MTAQIVGRGHAHQWRVDAPPSASKLDKAVLDAMVAELASRMFNDLTLRGSVRWRAIRAFTEHLDLYWESYRTPRDRALKLERAEAKLLEAIAEDEKFDLAFYNLGVVYSQLAETERAAAESSEYIKSGDRPLIAYQARLDAALVAFNRAVELNRDRAEAIYALAVHEYTRLTPEARDAREAIVCRCERVLELQPDHALAHELKGIAQIGLGDSGERSLRAAVRQSWRRLWRVEFAERSAPPTVDSLLPGARANLAAALGTLARFNFDSGSDQRQLRRADRLFEQACELAVGDTKAALLLAHGRTLEQRGRIADAGERYHTALMIDPENPVYWAHLAAARARATQSWADVRNFADGAFKELSPIYRRTLELNPPRTAVPMRDHTLEALERMYEALEDHAGVERVKALHTLAEELDQATRARDVAALRAIRSRYAGRAWEHEQIQIALARTLGRLDDWHEAETEYRELIEMLEHGRKDGIVQHSLRAKHARALRKLEHYEDALVTAADGQLENPLSACTRREVGKAHFALLHFEQALTAWQQTLWLTPNDPYLHWKVAFCHYQVAQDRHDEPSRRKALADAARCFDQAALLFGARLVKGWAWSQLWAGRVRQELGEHDAALSHLRSARELQADEPVLEALPRRGLRVGRQLRRGARRARGRPGGRDAGRGHHAGRGLGRDAPRRRGRQARDRGAGPARAGRGGRREAGAPADPEARGLIAVSGVTAAPARTASPRSTRRGMPSCWASASPASSSLAARPRPDACCDSTRASSIWVCATHGRARIRSFIASAVSKYAIACLRRPSRSASRPRWRAAEPDAGRRPADRHVAVGVRLEQVVQRLGVRRLAERGGGLGQIADGAEPEPVEREAAEVVGRERVEDLARLVAAVGLGEQVREHADPAGDGVEALGVGADRGLQALEPSALAPQRAGLQQRGVAGVGVLHAVAERHGRVALGLRGVELACQQQPHRAVDVDVQRVREPAPALGDPGEGVHLDVGRVDVAELEQVGHPPAVPGECQQLVARALGEAEQVVCGLQALLHVARAPQRPVASHEGEAQAARIADLAGELDRFAAELGAAFARLREAQLDRQPGNEPRAQCRLVVADRVERLLEQGDELVVDDAARHLARHPVAERRGGEQLGGAESARRVGRPSEGLLRLQRVARLGLRVAAGEQQPARQRGVGGRLVERLDGQLVEPRRLFVREHAGRALGGALGVLDRLRRRRVAAARARSGAASVASGGSSQSPARSSIASATRRCSRARRVAVSPS